MGHTFFPVRVIRVWNRLLPHIVAVDKVKTLVQALNSLSTEFFTAGVDSCVVSLVKLVYIFLFFEGGCRLVA